MKEHELTVSQEHLINCIFDDVQEAVVENGDARFNIVMAYNLIGEAMRILDDTELFESIAGETVENYLKDNAII